MSIIEGREGGKEGRREERWRDGEMERVSERGSEGVRE